MHEKINIHNTSTHRFGDPETFQLESKTGVGMIPTKLQYCSIKLAG
jgi:hypothetical protein